MFGGLNRLLATALVAGAALTAVLAGPSAALACNGSTSAENVYSPCLPSGGGNNGGHSTHSTGPSSGPTTTTHPYSSQTTKALNKAGKDKKDLKRVLKTYSIRRRLQVSHAGSAAAPSAVGSAFDLGSGPTALLVVLAGTAVLLLVGSGVRGWRRTHRA